MTQPDPICDKLQELSRQVRWLRHAIERLLWLLGLACGAATAWAVATIILKIGAA
jgi:hypothetical protein